MSQAPSKPSGPFACAGDGQCVWHATSQLVCLHMQVMTSVYGVTQLGARDQISSRLKERGIVADEHSSRAASYGAKACPRGHPTTGSSQLGPEAGAHASGYVLVSECRLPLFLVLRLSHGTGGCLPCLPALCPKPQAVCTGQWQPECCCKAVLLASPHACSTFCQ